MNHESNELQLMRLLDRAGSHMRNSRRVGGSLVSSHVVSRLFIRTSIKMGYHERSKSRTSSFTNFETTVLSGQCCQQAGKRILCCI